MYIEVGDRINILTSASYGPQHSSVFSNEAYHNMVDSSKVVIDTIMQQRMTKNEKRQST